MRAKFTRIRCLPWPRMLLPLLLLLAVVGLSAAWLYLQKQQEAAWEKHMQKQGATAPVPFVPGRLPLLGHMVTILRYDDPDNLMELSASMLEAVKGKTYQVDVLGRMYLMTTDPIIIKHMLSTKFETIYGKAKQLHDQYQEFLGEGIFNVNGDEWRRHRNVASGLFHVSNLKSFVDIFNDNAVRMFEAIELRMQQPGMKGQPVDMQDYFMRYTLESFAQIGFGVRMGSIEDSANHFASAFDVVQTETEHRGRYGNYWWLKEMIAPNKKLKENLAFMNDTVNSIIAERKGESIETLEGRSDVLSHLLLTNHTTPDKAYSEVEMRDFVMNFLLAGRDTTAELLTWACHMLALHPEVEEKVVAEIERELGSSEPTWANVKALTYTKQVLQETLRLFPPVPVDGYSANQDDILPTGVPVKKDTEIYYISYLMHRDPDVFDRPEEFLPERWEKPKHHPFGYVPFHAGPRQCLGKEMAYEEAKILLVNLLRRYRVRMADGFTPEVKIAIILTSRNGMLMHLDPR